MIIENASFCRKINNVCACCKYSRTGYETNDTSCYVFGDDVPDEYMNSNYDGCICSEDMLEKFCAENEKAWVKEATGFVDWRDEK